MATDQDLGGIAIVGLAAVFPGASDVDQLWDNIVKGRDSITTVSADRWDPVYYDPAHPSVDRFYCRRGGFIDTQSVVDPAALGVMPAVFDHAEPDQMLSLALAARAVADAGPEMEGARERVGVIVGRGGYLTPGVARLDQRVRMSEQLVTAVRSLLPSVEEDALSAIKDAFTEQLGPDHPEAAINLVPNLAASRIANRFDFRGPAYTVDAACASSLVAVDHAVHELRSRRCDLVVVGGVHLCHDVTLWSVFTQLGALSRSEQIQPFDERADGLLIGEGGGMMVLQRLDEAERSDSRIYGVIRGTGVSSDGRSASLMRPSVEGQLLSLQRAWQAAQLDPTDLDLIEAHGTATPTGDAAEVETLRRFFGDAGKRRPIVVGSIKSMIGHTMPAAGIAGLIKGALAVHHGVLPPTLHCERPRAELAESGFRILSEAEAWAGDRGPRRAAVNAFGFGGINAHVILEQHGASTTGSPSPSSNGHRTEASRTADPTPRSALGAQLNGALVESPAADPTNLLDDLELFAAVDAPDLLSQLHQYRGSSRWTSSPPGGPLRLAVFNPTPERIELARKVVEKGRAWRGRSDIWFSPQGLVTGGGTVAFVFPGVEPTFDPRVDDVARHFGLPNPILVGPEAVARDLGGLGRSIIAVGRLLHHAVSALGLRPDVMAGQSIGEWSGMIASEMIPADEIDEFIESLDPGSLEVPGVAFAALGCPVETAERLIHGQEGFAISHDNCPHQTIVCGSDETMDALALRARAEKVLCQTLPFRSGFHTEMFRPFVEPIRQALDRLPLQQAIVPLWSATTCGPYPSPPDEVRALAVAHLVRRVRFRELILALYAQGARVFVQVGSGRLPALIDDTLHGRDVLTVATNTPQRSGLDQLLRAVTACWIEGHEGIRFDRLAAQPESPPRSTRPGGDPNRLRRLPLQARLVRLPALETFAPDHTATPGGSLSSNGLLGAELQALLREVASSSDALARAFEESRTPEHRLEAAPTAPAVPELRSATQQRMLSVETLPALSDHCFFRQPPDWPSMVDRFPVVPMTALIELMVEEAAKLAPGMVPTRVERVRALRWLAVAPPVEVTIRVNELPDGGSAREGSGPDQGQRENRFRVSIEGYARADVVFMNRYPVPPSLPAPLGDPRACPVSAERLYEDRWMFHGPRYQGVAALGPIDDWGIDAMLMAGEAPGALLDNAGQVMGLWVMIHQERDRLALPTRVESVSFFAPRPEARVAVKAQVRVSHVDTVTVRANIDLSVADRPWARIAGWETRRFESDEPVWLELLYPETNTLAEEQEGGWTLAKEHWRNSNSRELMMRRYLTEAERASYEGHNPRAQRLFLLGRIAAKDAARRWLWQRGWGPIWPAEIEIRNDDLGRPIMCVPGDHDLRVSIAHTAWVGVAMVGDGADVGIDVEGVAERSATFVSSAFSHAELDALRLADQPERRDECLTRAWAAKEAVAKAIGSGLGGRPKDFVIEKTNGDTMQVNGRLVHTVLIDQLAVAYTPTTDKIGATR
jgi:phosphopantetheine--protein transferase-like protein